ncbi:MAG: hypothetical protein F2813_08820 [Actinobacteria bacterium]|uniref:Unannotated protein n=1 Tax=freshwater metagenome TaxID=449393 RepID=A0A6J6A206_9ZZZZ|nr:hypothetical protein [Actinomycetota bacterium]
MTTSDATSPWALDPEATKRLPRGRHKLSRDQVLASQRGRMLHAVLIATAKKGFGYCVVGDVISAAGVSRKAFYEHFRDFEDCWFQAYETAAEVLISTVVSATVEADAAGDPGRATAAGIRALMELIVEEPAVAHATIVDIAGAGPEGLKARQRNMHSWADLMLITFDGVKGAKPTPERRLQALAAVSIAEGILVEYLVSEKTDELPAVSDQVAALMSGALTQ